MASTTPVSFSTILGSPSFSTSGFLPIRAPITPEDDSSDFESNGHVSDASSSAIDNGSDTDEYVSGEEFESASEKLFLADPDDENQFFRPFVANPEEESLGNSTVEEESGFTDDFSPVVDSGNFNLQLNMPIAKLSMDQDDFQELMCEEEMVSGEVEDGSFSGVVKVPSFGVLERMDSAARVKLFDVEEDSEDELWVLRDSEDLVSDKFLGADNGVLGSKDDKFAVKSSADETFSVELIKEECHIVTSLTDVVEALVANKGNEEMKEDVKQFGDDSASVELIEDKRHVVIPEVHIKSLESKENVLVENSQLDDEAKEFSEGRLSFEEKIELNGINLLDAKSMENGVMNNVSEQCSGSQLKEQIAEALNSCGDTYERDLNQVDNIVAELQELKNDTAGQIKEQISKVVNFSSNSFETVIKPVDESAQKLVPEPQDLLAKMVEFEVEKTTDFENNDQSSLISGSVAFEKGSDNEKLEDKCAPKIVVRFESLAPEDATEMNKIQSVDLLGNGDFPEMFEGDRLDEASHSNTDCFGISHEVNCDPEQVGEQQVLLSDEDIKDMLPGGTRTTEHIRNEAGESSVSPALPLADDFYDHPQRTKGQNVADSDGKLEADEEHEENKLFDFAQLSSLLKAATSAKLDGGSIRLTSAHGSRVFSVEHPVDGSTFNATSHAPDMVKHVMNDNMTGEEKKMIEKVQYIGVKFLRLVQRLGHSSEDSKVAQVLHRLLLAARGHVGKEFNLESCKRMALQLEAEGQGDFDFDVNILVVGKTGVGKSATINSILGEKKVMTDAFEPVTTKIKEIVETIDGVRMRILDTPGLRSSVHEEATNRKILSSIKKSIKKFPPDVVLYVDRLDSHARDLNDLPLLVSLTNALTPSIWRNAIVTLTHAAATPPEGPHGSPVSFEMFVAQRSHVVQRAISKAVGDLWLMHPVSLVENHPSCLKNKNGETILPNGQSWRSQLLLLCYSLKVISEVSSITKPQEHADHTKLLGLRFHPLPLPSLVSSLLQSRPHPKLTTKQGGDGVDSDMEMLELSDSDEEDEDEYDQLPPFKPLRKSQVNKLTKEQKKAYFEEYDHQVKLLQKKQLREEVKRLKELKKTGQDRRSDEHSHIVDGVDQEDEGPATVPVSMPDFILPPSFDSGSPSYRYRTLEPTSELLVIPVESQGWDHDSGYDGISLEGNLAIAGQFPGAFSVQFMKDKKKFNIQLDSSVCAKYGENKPTMAGFNIQNIGRQLAYILRCETKFKNYKINKTSGGICITLLGKNVATGLRVEDQIAIVKRLALVGSAGVVRSEGDIAYGANFEVHLKSKEFPIVQDQSTLGFSLLKWRGDLGLMANLQSQFSIGGNSKMTIRVGMNNMQNGQITIKTSSSELQVALISIVPMVISVLRSICPGVAVRKSKNAMDYW